MQADAAVRGACDARFAAVGDVLAESVARGQELGASVAVVVEGRAVVDLHGGTARAGRPWREGTLVNVYSVTKPFAALCLLVLVERGLVALDVPVARYWPEFAAAGKGEITVRQALAHQAGLDLFEQPLAPEDLLEWPRATALLAGAAPRWPPGSAHGEHAAFYGHLVGEVVRRVSGRTVGRFLRDEVAGPWSLDVLIGLGPGERRRAADVVDPGGAVRAEVLAAGGAYRLALDNPPAMLDPAVVNGSAWRQAEIPAVNGHATALGVARLYAGLAAGGELDGVRLLSPELVGEATRAQRSAVDLVLGENVGWGLGVQVDDDGFGLGGVGGSLGWYGADGYALGFVTRRLGSFERAIALDEAVRSSL